MSIVSELASLLTKMGGTPSAGDNSDELIDKIANVYTPGGGSGSGAKELFFTSDGGSTYVANMTCGEIMNAIPFLYSKYGNNLETTYTYYTEYTVDNNQEVVTIQDIYYSGRSGYKADLVFTFADLDVYPTFGGK